MVKFRTVRLSIFFTLLSIWAMAQVINPINWSSETKALPDGNYELIMTAQMGGSWHVYSTTHAEGGIGLPTTFTWEDNKDLELIGGIKEIGKLHDEFVEAFGEKQKYYSEKVSFVQKVKALKNTTAKVEVMFQACDDEKCIAPDYKTFTFDLKANTNTSETEVATTTNQQEGENLDSLILNEGNNIFTTEIKKDSASVEKNSVTEENTTTNNASRTLIQTFILGFLGGLAALVMPCIFPMIPLTVSMFTKQSKNRKKGITKALIYGLSIITIYVILGLIITAIFGAGALNELATHPALNIAFFVLFIIFAISFFGAFEITLPSKWINKADKNADKGGYIGVFFMALTLTLVSFSCTGPIIGTLLVDAARSGALLGPAIGMFGFSLALALPFTLFAIFPSWLNSLPNSGGWLNTVKVCLGFIELAFALKFLSNADLAMEKYWLERELFIALWIGLFFVMGLYLLNVFRMKLDSVTDRISTPRLLFAILSFVAVFYLLPGMWGAPLKIVSGLIPPIEYSELPVGFSGQGNNNVSSTSASLPEKAHYGPHQIPVFHDLDDAIAYAKEVKKPIMIDFTGKTCANCRKVESNVWIDSRVKEKLSNDVVVASLYVDSFIDLPEEERKYSEEKGRKLRTIGDKWSAFQIKEFNSNAQPLYVIVDEDLNRYNEPIGVEMDINKYLEWIDKGVQNFNNRK